MPVIERVFSKGSHKIAYTIAAYFENGYFTWKPVTFTQYPVCGKYESLMAAFELELLKKLGSGTARGGMVIIRQFLYFLEQSGKGPVP